MTSASGSPEHSPPGKATQVSNLAGLKAARDAARAVSANLRKEFEALESKVNPAVAPDQDKPEPDFQDCVALADVGIRLASEEKKEINLEKDVVAAEQGQGMLTYRAAAKNLDKLQRRYFSAGDDLWKFQKKKIRLDDTLNTVQTSNTSGPYLADCLLALYKKSDGQDNRRDRKQRPKNFRKDAMSWYNGDSERDTGLKNMVWCHAIGNWQLHSTVKAAHIVPFFLESEGIAEFLFGSRAPDLDREANSLLLTSQVEKWFDSYNLVIVPVDTKETPIRRWRIELLSNSFSTVTLDTRGFISSSLHERELTFRNENRPAARFLYFHFLMALVRIKDLKRSNWQSIWARYHYHRPFPTPGNYIRNSMLIALAKYSGTTDMDTIGSWIRDNGFDSPLSLTSDEAREAARRVLETVYRSAAESDRAIARDSDDGSESEDDDQIDDEDKRGGD